MGMPLAASRQSSAARMVHPAGLPQCSSPAARRQAPHAASAQSPACRLLTSLAGLLACHDEEVQHNAAWAVHALAKHSQAAREALLRCPALLPAVLALLQHPAQPVASAAITAVAHFAHEPTSALEGVRLPSMAALAEQLQQLLGSPALEAQEGACAAVVSLARTSDAHAGLLQQQQGLPGRLVELMSAGTGHSHVPDALRGQSVDLRSTGAPGSLHQSRETRSSSGKPEGAARPLGRSQECR